MAFSAAQEDELITVANVSMVCFEKGDSKNRGIWIHGNPLLRPTDLLLFQISSISIASQLIHVCLKPLGQSILVSQIVGGMLLGPSVFGFSRKISNFLFPARGIPAISIFAALSIIFFLFMAGVKMDPRLMVRPGRKAAIIGASGLIVAEVFTNVLAAVLRNSLSMSTQLDQSIMLIAASQPLNGFPVIATLLTELKIINTDVGRLALSAGLFADFLNIIILGVLFCATNDTGGDLIGFLLPFMSIILFLASIFLILRPRLTNYYHKLGPKTVGENSMTLVFVLVLLAALASEVIGQHYLLGPLLLGLAVPEGPPLGAAISTRLDTLGRAFFYPVFCALSGLQTDVSRIDFRSLYIVGIIVAFAFVIKFTAVVLPALYFSVPMRDAFVLGLILNAKGIVELTAYNLWRESEQIEEGDFAVVMLSVIIVSGMVTPIIKFMYNPSKEYISSKRRSTIHHGIRDSEFRILVCLHSHEDAPSIMNVLELCNPSRGNPVFVTAMHLVELVGRSNPVLVHNNSKSHTPTPDSAISEHVFKAMTNFEECYQDSACVQTYTSISHFRTMHDDICRVAYDTRSHIILVPFHKQWTIDGTIGNISRPIQNLNLKILENAPCSVGILVDRGSLTSFSTIRASQSKFHVVVLFLGGPDDMEALAYGSRMVKHDHVSVTVIRFLVFGGENSKDRKNDTQLINEYRQLNMSNERFVYVEEVLRDAEGLSSYITGSLKDYNLILVGRYHPDSPLLAGLGELSECPELGVLGDTLASPDFKANTTVIVIQQQRLGGMLLNQNLPFVVRDRDRERDRASSVISEECIRPSPAQQLQQVSRNDSFSIISLDDYDTL